MSFLSPLTLLVLTKDPVPADNDVVAGPWGAVVFIGLAIAVALLGWSLSRHLRKVRENQEKGVFGPPDDADSRPRPTT